MCDRKDRLIGCFSSVFPALSDREIQVLSSEDGGEWDSLSTVTLVSVIEEEFAVSIHQDRIPELTSFAAFDEYLSELLAPEGSTAL